MKNEGFDSCSEMVMPIGNSYSNNMLPLDPFNSTIFIKDLKDAFGVPPRPHWATTYYGDHVCFLYSSFLLTKDFFIYSKRTSV